MSYGRAFILALGMVAPSAPVTAETFWLPVDADGGFEVDLDWAGRASLAEMRFRTGERGEPFKGGSEKLLASDPEHLAVLDKVFEDAAQATARVECHQTVMVLVCRNTKGLRIKPRYTQGSASEAFVSRLGYVLCVEGLAGSGACVDATPRPRTATRR